MPTFQLTCTLLLPALLSAAQPRTAVAADDSLATLTSVFVGSWRCQGHFANGHAISSAESFTPTLDGHWLLQEHSDHAPFNYRAHALWGFSEDLKRFTLTIYDNFGGQRVFTSPGWEQSVLIFEVQALLAPPARQERFRYQRLASGGYSVEYQVLDKSGAWKMGDVLECRAAH
jgi:hypothetical protein